MWSNIKGMIFNHDIDYGYKDDSFYLSIPPISKENFKKNWGGWLFQTLVFFFAPLYVCIFGIITYYTKKEVVALYPALITGLLPIIMLFIGIFLFRKFTRIRLINFFYGHLIVSDKYLFGEKRIAKIQRHEVPELIIKKGIDTEIPKIKDIELLLPFKGKNYKIVSHRTAEDLEKIEEIFASYRNSKNILELASNKNYSSGKITDDNKYEAHVPISGLDRDVKRFTLLFLFHYICCICGSFLSLSPTTLEIAQLFIKVCFALSFGVVIYGELIRKEYVGKEKDPFLALFKYIPTWLKSINILSFIWFIITTQLSVDDFFRGWLHIPINAAITNGLLKGFSMFMLLTSLLSANNISRLLKFKASNHKHIDS
jgi:hypothetical protein